MSENDRWQSLVALALGLGVLALAFFFGFQKIRTFDYWWHLRAGALMAETGRVPLADPFSFTAEGARWIDIHWLFQRGLHGIYAATGHAGVVWAKILSVVLLVATLAPIGARRVRPAISALALTGMLLVAGDRFMPRPELPSFLLLAALLALLERDRRAPESDPWLIAVLPLQLLWVNVHGLFALGIAVCAIYTAAEALRPLLQPEARIRPRRLGRLAALTLGVALVALLNPNGLDGALYPVQQLGMIGPPEERGVFGSLIAELVPPLAGTLETPATVLVQAGLLAGVAFLAMAFNWRQVSGAHPLLWVAFAYLALGARRNMALLAIVCVPIAVVNLNEFLDRHPLPRSVGRGLALVSIAIVFFFGWDVGSGRFFPRIGAVREPGLGVSQIYYPAGAVEWIRRERPPGPLCHHMADGGYLLWHLYPDYRAMVDGRLEVYGPELFSELQLSSPENFRALDAKHDFGAILVHYALTSSEPLLRWLHLNSKWRLVFVDETAALYLRARGGESPLWSELDVHAPDLFPTPAESLPVGPVAESQLLGRTSWYRAMRQPERALETWEQKLTLQERGRSSISRNDELVHAGLLAGAGRNAAAETILQRLLRDTPEDPVVLSQLGDLRVQSDDPDAAQAHYERALQADPRFVYAVLQRAKLAERQGDFGHARLLYTQVTAIASPWESHAQEAIARLTAMTRAGK